LINFRFHLISLIAVFLALAVGVVMGYGVLGQPTVDTLQNRIDNVEARANRIKAENNELRAENGRLSDAMQAVGTFAVTNRLESSSVVPVAVRGVNEDQVVDAVQLARDGGAAVPGVIWLEEKWDLDNPDDVAELAAIVGTQSTSRASVRDAAARALATRMSSGPATGGRVDLLEELADAKFVSLQSVGDGPSFEASTFDGRGSARSVDLLIGGTDAVIPASRGTVPLAQALVALGLPVVVADDWREVEGGPGRGSGLEGILGDEQLRSAVATVDNLDQADGPLTLVLALADRVGQGVIEHYGFGAGATRPMPEWWDV
jgi:hypothetical protein